MILPTLRKENVLDADHVSIRRLSPRSDDLHAHDFLELVYVMHGSARHRLGLESYPVSAGDYFIVDLGTFHCYYDTADFVIVNCLFTPDYVDRALSRCASLSALLSNTLRQFGISALSPRPADRIYHDESGTVRRLVEAMEREYAQREAGYVEMVRCRLIEILVLTVRAAARGASSAAQPHPAVAAMAEYLQKHLREPLSLQAMQRELGYTPQYLSALFHRETGESLRSYLQKLRIEKSCLLLAQEEQTVAGAAQQVGYNDSKHFYALFKRYTGLSPREFRARARGSQNPHAL